MGPSTAVFGLALVAVTGFKLFIRRRKPEMKGRRPKRPSSGQQSDRPPLSNPQRVVPIRRDPSLRPPSAHPLAGTVKTAVGHWTITVLSDRDDHRTRRFTLSLLPHARPSETKIFVVRVPRTVIENERPTTWPGDLRQELAYWISINAIERGEMIWWPLTP